MSDNGHITWTNDTRPLGDLVPWEHNPREINTKEARRLGDSLVEFGQIQTIAIGPDDEVYDGHQRKAVWSLLPEYGPEHLVDVRVSSRALTEQERQKLVVYLHRGTAGTWDWDELANSFEVPDLLEWGFEESELQLDWGKDETPDPGAQVDKAAELQEKWQVARGQVWQAGRHRVMCGDSTCAEDVARLMGNTALAMVNTDPSYGVGYSGENETMYYGDGRKGQKREPLEGDADTDTAMKLVFDALSLVVAPVAFVWCAPQFHDLAKAAVAGAGYEMFSLIVWNKNVANFAQMGARYKPKYEMALACKRDTIPWYGPANEVTVWDIDRNVANKLHPTEKPAQVFVRAIQNHTTLGEVVGDPFLGSGTTLVACEQTSRIGYGMEIEPKYVAVTLERLTGMGLEAVLVEPVIQAGTGG